MIKKILIFGGGGLVGSRFIELSKSKYEIISPDVDELNILEADRLNIFLDQNKIDAMINFAAFTDVDGAEKEKNKKDGLVFKLNADAPKNLAKLAKDKNIYFVQISTAFVFPGTADKKGPYLEDSLLQNDSENIGWYGRTKLFGEQNIKAENTDTAILRIDYPFRSQFERGDFARNILNLFDQGKLYPMFNDQFFRPSFIDQIVEVLQKLIDEKISGVFHSASANTVTPFGFATFLLEKMRNVKDIVKPFSIIDFQNNFPDKSPRPQFGGLETEQTAKNLRVQFLSWQEEIEQLLKQL